MTDKRTKIMKHTISHIWQFVALTAALAVAAAMTACSLDHDDVPAYGRVPLTLIASIEGAPATAATDTRAKKYPTHDLWSNFAFETGDELGFFSKTGGGTAGNQPMENVKLVAESVLSGGGAKFRAEDGTNIEASRLTAENVHFYFPYDKNIAGPGLELRVEDKDKDDGIKRCTDFLVDDYVDATFLEKGELSGVIQHAFGELIITRGEGFEAPGSKADGYKEDDKDYYERITVVMRNPVTHITIEYNANPWKWGLKLTNDKSASNRCDGGDARRWQAWKGDLYGQTADSKGQEAWYVIVPTLKGQPSIVEYIEIFDNEGKQQKVSVLRLDDKDDSNVDRDHQDRDGNYVWAGWRYPMQIAMKELVPTVNPYPILPWDQTDNDITNKRAPGISNSTDFVTWSGLYASYLASGRSDSYEESLKAYGDLEKQDDNNVWHFYISADIEFDKAGNHTISVLEDILDGQSATLNGYAFSNNTLTNVTKTFVDKLNGNGSLRNLDFKSPTVTADTQPQAGIIANTINGGEVTNCNISNGGLIGNATTAVGIVAGSITGGTVENCTLSGLIIGNASDAESGYMFGTMSGAVKLTNNNCTNVSFSDINQTTDD